MITHYVGNRSPSMQDTITVNGDIFDLSGKSVTFKMRPEDSATTKVSAAAAITNAPGTDGEVHYDWQAADVDTGGRFLFWWSVVLGGGVTQDTPESLIVFLQHAPISRALCTLEDVQAYIPGYVPYSDRQTDAILLEKIDEVSVEIHNDANRDFLPVATNPYAKTFDVSAFEAAEMRIFVGDLRDAVGLILSLDGTDISTQPFHAEPRNRQPWEPYSYIKFDSGGSVTINPDSVLTVTGNWGFPQIPPDIRQACVKLVINRYVRDVATGGTAFADAVTDAAYSLSSAFASAQDTIASYTFYVIA